MGTSFDRVEEKSRKISKTAKGLQGALGGLVATGGGVAMIMQGDILNGILMLEGGFGKLALSVAKMAASYVAIGVQALIAGGKMALAWLIGLGPIALVILGIGAVIGILAVLGIGFDDIKRIATGVWNWIATNWPLLLAILTGPIGLAVLAIWRHRNSIISAFRSAFSFVKGFATDAKNWIVARFNDVISFFKGIPGRVRSIFSGLGRALVDSVKALWNSTIGGFKIGGWDPPGPGKFPAFTIPKLHQGGIMPGAPGSEGLALLQAGERVTRAGASQPTVVNHFHIAGSIRSDRELVRLIRDEFGRGGFGGVLP
jgi:hypothetical protein